MTVAAVDRCLDVIETLSSVPDGLPLGDLADRLNVPKAAAFRLLQTLAKRGYVRQDASSQEYRLSLEVAMLGFRHLDTSTPADAAQAVLQRLAQACGEYARMTRVDGERLVWVARAQGATQGLRYDPPMGLRVVAHATASGKAWLATLPEADAMRIAYAHGFGRADLGGPRALRTPDALARDLDAIRRRGYALAVEEAEAGTVAIAAAFRAGDGAAAPVLGTVSIAGPQVRMPSSRLDEIATLVRAAAAELARLGPLLRRQRAPDAPPA